MGGGGECSLIRVCSLIRSKTVIKIAKKTKTPAAQREQPSHGARVVTPSASCSSCPSRVSRAAGRRRSRQSSSGAGPGRASTACTSGRFAC